MQKKDFRKDFESKNIEEQLNIINECLEKNGGDRDKVSAELFGLSGSWLSQYMNGVGFTYSRSSKVYIEKPDKKEKEEVMSVDLIGTLAEQLNVDRDSLEGTLKRLSGEEAGVGLQFTKDYKENYLRDEIKTKSIRVSEKVYEKFEDFCEENIQYNKRDIVNMMMLEFIEKYDIK